MRGQGTRFPTGSGTGRTALDILTGAGEYRYGSIFYDLPSLVKR